MVLDAYDKKDNQFWHLKYKYNNLVNTTMYILYSGTVLEFEMANKTPSEKTSIKLCIYGEKNGTTTKYQLNKVPSLLISKYTC